MDSSALHPSSLHAGQPRRLISVAPFRHTSQAATHLSDSLRYWRHHHGTGPCPLCRKSLPRWHRLHPPCRIADTFSTYVRVRAASTFAKAQSLRYQFFLHNHRPPSNHTSKPHDCKSHARGRRPGRDRVCLGRPTVVKKEPVDGGIAEASFVAQDKLVDKPCSERLIAVVPQVFATRQPFPAMAFAGSTVLRTTGPT